MLDDVLAHLHASSLAPLLVLRGSLLTQTWIPWRGADDIDVLVDGDWTPASLAPLAAGALRSFPGAAVEVTTIWEETSAPGLRARVTRGERAVQVDLSWGERLAAPPRPTTVRGRTWRSVCPEVMFGWKAHSLVEHGPRGRWHPKSLADLVLLRRCLGLDLTLCARAVHLAFESRGQPLAWLDGLLDDPTWGRSRGSRNKWKAYVKRAPWVDFALEAALEEARALLLPMVR